MKIGSLFSGIGGLELGLERAGLGRTVWQCEINPFCRTVLKKHWPNAVLFEDITTLTDCPPVDVLCGGFPCQDVSSAGKRAGLSGTRSGLWREYLRIINALRPRIVVIENVASGASLWLPAIVRNLSDAGYTSKTLGVSARDVGGYHHRRRIFVVAYPDGELGGGLESEPLRRFEKLSEAGSERLAIAWPEAPPENSGMVDGVRGRLDKPRVAALANAVVPQCAQLVGAWIKRNLTAAK